MGPVGSSMNFQSARVSLNAGVSFAIMSGATGCSVNALSRLNMMSVFSTTRCPWSSDVFSRPIFCFLFFELLSLHTSRANKKVPHGVLPCVLSSYSYGESLERGEWRVYYGKMDESNFRFSLQERWEFGTLQVIDAIWKKVTSL